MSVTEDKMYAIAKHYNYLNDRGNVKAIKGNEKGYAKIKEIARGCSLFVHHWNNDQLVINLMISPAAKTRYELLCNNAVEVFRSQFLSEVQTTKWENSLGNGKPYDCYYVDVTRRELQELFIMIEDVRKKLMWE